MERSSWTVSAQQLQSWRLLEEFRTVLQRVEGSVRPRPKGGPKRLLTEEDYLSAFLFAQLNPVIDSMRGLCACSKLERVQQEVCTRPISLGSFSEAQSVFGFERLERVFELLVKENLQLKASGQLKGSKLPAALQAVDSTVLRALPRMNWAEWRYQNTTQRAVRLHLKFNLCDRSPTGAHITDGRSCERKALLKMVTTGEFYVGDRYYGRDYQLFGVLEEKGCDYIIRLCENANRTVMEELELEPQDRSVGVVSDQVVRLGARQRWHSGPVRIVRIEKPELDEAVMVVTNRLDPKSFPAALIAEIYRHRWSIELFFRWFKCVLGKSGKSHWLAESSEGAAIQLYTALIASLLLARRLGKLPGKRCMEALCFHAMGMASTEELEQMLRQQLRKKAS